MIIEGDFTIQAPQQKVWDFLVDIQEMSTCLPGVDEVAQTSEYTYAGKVTVKVGPIAASFKGSAELLVQDSPTYLKAKLQGKDNKTASMVSGEFESTLSETEGSATKVSYKFNIKIRGRLGQFGQAVILDTSRQLTDAFVACVKARVEHEEDTTIDLSGQADMGAVATRAVFNVVGQTLRDAWLKLLKALSKD